VVEWVVELVVECGCVWLNVVECVVECGVVVCGLGVVVCGLGVVECCVCG